MKHFKVMMACCCCLVLAHTATAQMVTGISADIKTQPIQEMCGAVPCPPIDCGPLPSGGVDVCNVFADFDGLFRSEGGMFE